MRFLSGGGDAGALELHYLEEYVGKFGLVVVVMGGSGVRVGRRGVWVGHTRNRRRLVSSATIVVVVVQMLRFVLVPSIVAVIVVSVSPSFFFFVWINFSVERDKRPSDRSVLRISPWTFLVRHRSDDVREYRGCLGGCSFFVLRYTGFLHLGMSMVDEG